MGWRVLTIWECALKGPHKYDVREVARIAHEFIAKPRTSLVEMTITGGKGRRAQSERNYR